MWCLIIASIINLILMRRNYWQSYKLNKQIINIFHSGLWLKIWLDKIILLIKEIYGNSEFKNWILIAMHELEFESNWPHPHRKLIWNDRKWNPLNGIQRNLHFVTKKKNINFDKLWLFISWILLATLKLNLKIQKAFSFLKIYI